MASTPTVELYGRTVSEGSYMLLLNGSANRDETRFAEPDRYDIHRAGGHVSFGLVSTDHQGDECRTTATCQCETSQI